MEKLMAMLHNFETENLVALMQEMNLAELIANPAFLGTMAVIAAICLFTKWHGLLAIVFGLTGFTWLLSYTLQQGTELDGASNPTLLVFVGGGVVIVGVVIYLLFIKSDD